MRETLTYTDLFASDEDKATSTFGLKVANAISEEWFNGGMIQSGCGYADRRDWIRERRVYALGQQDLKVYKDVIAREKNDLSYMNLDWRPTNILGKFNRVVADGMDENAYDVTVKAIDQNSIKALRSYERTIRTNMVAKQIREDAYAKLGIDLRPATYVPEDEEDMEMHMMLKPKVKIEIAEETLIDNVFKYNGWDIIKPLINQDLVTCGIGVSKCYTDKIEGVRVKRVDPEFFVHSYVTTPFFTDAYYYGEVRSVTIADLQKEGQFSNEELMKIANTYSAKNGAYIMDYTGDYLSDSVLDYSVAILDFTYRTNKDIVYKKTNKKKGVKYSQKDASYNPPKRNDYSKEKKTVNTWYEGCYVIGTDYLYNYMESENISKDNMGRVMANYTAYAPDMYKNNLSSFSSSIEAIADKMNYVDLKLQHLVAEIKPDGAEINMDKLYELAADSKSNQQEILSLFAVKGIVLSKTVTDEGGNEYRSRAVEQVRNGVPDNLFQLVQIWEHYYNVIREITGVNPYRDGTMKQDTLVGVQKMGLLQSNIATKYISRGSIFITQRTAECVTSRIGTIFRWGGQLKENYIEMLGAIHVNVLDAIKNRNLATFGIYIEMRPSDEEIQDLNQNIALAIQAGDIKVEDKIEVLNIGNFKRANAYLRYVSKKRRQQMQQDQAMQVQQQMQANEQAAVSAAEQQRQTAMFMAELDVKKEAQISQIRIQEDVVKMQMQMQVDEPKYQTQMAIAEINAIGNQGLNQYKEDKKDNRTKMQATQQSELIGQRQNGGQPIDFENQFDFGALGQM